MPLIDLVDRLNYVKPNRDLEYPLFRIIIHINVFLFGKSEFSNFFTIYWIIKTLIIFVINFSRTFLIKKNYIMKNISKQLFLKLTIFCLIIILCFIFNFFICNCFNDNKNISFDILFI